MCRIDLDHEEPLAGGAAAAPRPAKKPAARRSGGEERLREAKQALAGLLELEADARKWYGATAAAFFDELGRRVDRAFRGIPPAPAPDYSSAAASMAALLTEAQEGLYKLPSVAGQVPEVLLQAHRRRQAEAGGGGEGAGGYREDENGAIVID